MWPEAAWPDIPGTSTILSTAGAHFALRPSRRSDEPWTWRPKGYPNLPSLVSSGGDPKQSAGKLKVDESVAGGGRHVFPRRGRRQQGG